jgi:hypothetical protein
VLVLTDLHYPGWRVSVDGEPRALRRANAIFRAVVLEPGEHRVVHRYAPGSLRLGLGAALAASIAGGALLWADRRRSRAPWDPPHPDAESYSM